MYMAGAIQSEIGWAKVFLAFLKEAEMESDQIRMSGMGIRWTPAPTPHHGSDLMEYFERLDTTSNAVPSPNRLAKAVGSRIVRTVK
jgi:hypothetical protein